MLNYRDRAREGGEKLEKEIRNGWVKVGFEKAETEERKERW